MLLRITSLFLTCAVFFFANQIDHREVMLWRADLNLCPATDVLEAAFCLVTTFRSGTTPVAALFAGKLDETKGELSPISP
jgi:hypothetical protein